MSISIPCPPWTTLGRSLESKLRKALFDFKMLNHESKIAIALSGGKDSLSLLFLLKAISGRGFPLLDLHAIHVSGEFSCGAGVNEDYLRDICQKLDVPFIQCKSNQKLETLECYSCSRERRALIFKAAKKIDASIIAFGHHRDDFAQTLMMNLLHKAEFAGQLPKICMQEYGVTIIRPLIYISEQEIRNFAHQYGFQRVSCRCPVGQSSMRKKVDGLLSEIEILFPNARQNLLKAGLIYGSQKAANP